LRLVSPAPLSGIRLTSDGDGRYVVGVQGRLPPPRRPFPFLYARALRLRPGEDPGRPRRAVTAQPEGPALVRGRLAGDLVPALDAAIVAAAEEQLAEMALHISRLTDSGFTATTVSVSRIEVRPPGTSGAVDATLDFSPGALVGGNVAPEPEAPVID
jgi:hypothetical protein